MFPLTFLFACFQPFRIDVSVAFSEMPILSACPITVNALLNKTSIARLTPRPTFQALVR